MAVFLCSHQTVQPRILDVCSLRQLISYFWAKLTHLLHLTGQPNWKKSRSAKVKDGIINLFLRNNIIDRYMG